MSITNNQLLEIFSQRFPVDSLIADPNLLLAIKSFGGDSLKRITFASPCHDTISIGKNGDTLKCYDYLWMVLHLNNDTNAINASIWLTILHQDKIVGASLNFLYKPFREPSLSRDPYYTSQKSLHGQSYNFPLSGFNRAWDFQTGNNQIRVSILDDGIDYRNCDLGANYGTGYKVVDSWNFSEPSTGFAFNSLHGTQVAGIVSAIQIDLEMTMDVL